MFNFKFERRKLIILSLVFVLISISYLNYMINKRSALETSSGLKEYEEKQLSEMNNEEEPSTDAIIHEGPADDETATSSMTMVEDEKETDIVDSSKNELEDIMAVANTNIQDSLVSNNLAKANYFLQAKIDIEIEREKTIERFDEIINNQKVDEDSRKKAVDKKLKVIDVINKEKIVESLIKSKGYEDAVVFITNEGVYITVQSEELAQADIAKILDIVTRETKYSIDNIKIQSR
ncbi:SpoIIIAH-like family protein [Wukongibacter baidiensis]|uniref:SpoIIIAH-like family protein n=1 Tax=Wukongibacter baidiensis TaxID=1723361 RepID=UPI003D7FEC59